MATGLSLWEQFIALFNNLKEAAGNSPERVPVFYKDSKAIRDALDTLHTFLARTDLERRVFHGRKLFILRAMEFETAWKEYDAKWRFRVAWPELTSDLDLLDLDLDLDAEPDPSEAQHERPWRGEEVEPEPPAPEGEPDGPDPEFEDVFDPLSHNGGFAIELGIEQLQIVAETWPGEYSGNSARLAAGAYDYLTETIGLNVHNVFRCWRKVPVVFMPAHVSKPYGSSDKGSLLHLLDDAVRADVFGAPAAAIAMCRTALEMVLKRHYGRGQWDDEKLDNLIVLASYKYSKIVQKERVDPFRKLANRILHKYDEVDRLSEEDDRTVLNFFRTLKFLIQRAPDR